MNMKGFAVLKDIARIMTPKVYENLCSNSPDFKNQQLLFVPKQFTFHFSLSSLKEPLHLDNKEGTLIMLKDKPNPVITFSYLSFYLNSIAGKAQYIFDNEQRTYRKTITKKILSDCIILFPSDKTIQYYYSIVQEILDRNATSKTEDKYTHLWKDMFTELREGLAIELTMADELKKYGISIFEQWKALWDKCLESKNPNNAAYNDLLRPDSATMQQLKKFRIIMITDQQIKSKVLEYGHQH